MSATMAPPVNASPVSTTDRSNRFDASTSSELARIRSEYIEMPGLVLTLPQAARLWGFGPRRAAELLTVLLDAGFLACDQKAMYQRLGRARHRQERSATNRPHQAARARCDCRRHTRSIATSAVCSSATTDPDSRSMLRETNDDRIPDGKHDGRRCPA